MNVIEFLNARLDEDEARARAAADEKREVWQVEDESDWEEDADVWHQWPGWIVGVNPKRGPNETVIDRDPDHDGRAARHIARHDPARVLREVKGKRELVRIACHVNWMDCVSSVGDDILKEMAFAYSDHPDYVKIAS